MVKNLQDMFHLIVKVKEFMDNQGYKKLKTPKLYQDNSSVIALMKNGGSKKYRNKYMRVRAEGLRESWLSNGDIAALFVRTREMLADVLTKPLQGQLFQDMTSGLLTPFLKTDVTGVR